MVNPMYVGQKGTYRFVRPLPAGSTKNACIASVEEIRKENSWVVEPGPKIGDEVVIKWPKAKKAKEAYTADESREFLKELYSIINRELDAFKNLTGLPYIARIYDSGATNVSLGGTAFGIAIFVVEEYLKGENFKAYLKRKFGVGQGAKRRFSGISDPQVFFSIALQLATRLRAVHQRGVIHGDIWENNIMVMPDGDDLRFIDFGSSRIRYSPFLHPDALAKLRVDPYVAPERLERKTRREGRRSDIYSVGALFYYMATGKPPPPADREQR